MVITAILLALFMAFVATELVMYINKKWKKYEREFKTQISYHDIRDSDRWDADREKLESQK